VTFIGSLVESDGVSNSVVITTLAETKLKKCSITGIMGSCPVVIVWDGETGAGNTTVTVCP